MSGSQDTQTGGRRRGGTMAASIDPKQAKWVREFLNADAKAEEEEQKLD